MEKPSASAADSLVPFRPGVLTDYAMLNKKRVSMRKPSSVSFTK